jgi:magnesium transporter
MPAPDIADLLAGLEKPARVLLFRVLPRQSSSEVFSYLESSGKDALLKDLTNEEAGRLLAGLNPDDRTEFFEELPGRVTQRLLNLLSPDDLREARRLLGYPEESVGRLMTPDYVAVRPDWTVERALEHIRTKGRDSETINVIYVTDESWRLIDALDLRQFILAQSADTVRQSMDYSFVSIPAFEDREIAVELIQRYDLDALPVVDSDGVLLGIVTVDDVFDVAQEEATEDILKGAAVAPLKASYRESGVLPLYRKRIGWLGALVLVSLVSSGVIALYQETLASTVALAFFIPLLIGTGGNAGAQSATLMVRALATGDIEPGDWARAFAKELAVGATLGLTMGLGGWALGIFRGGAEVGLVVGLAMVLIVIVANLLGAALPFLLTRLRLDPAVASSPLIASVADAAGLIIYFSLASRIIGGS